MRTIFDRTKLQNFVGRADYQNCYLEPACAVRRCRSKLLDDLHEDWCVPLSSESLVGTRIAMIAAFPIEVSQVLGRSFGPVGRSSTDYRAHWITIFTLVSNRPANFATEACGHCSPLRMVCVVWAHSRRIRSVAPSAVTIPNLHYYRLAPSS